MGDTVLLIDDQVEVRDYVSRVLKDKGFDVISESDGNAGFERFQKESSDLSLVILDLDLGPDSPGGMDILAKMRQEAPEIPVVILTGKGTMEAAIDAMKAGAQDFLAKDLYIEGHLEASMEKMKRFVAVVQENRRLQKQVATLGKEAKLYKSLMKSRYQIVGDSPAFREVLDKAQKVSSIPRPVLIQGERGTGKELIAATVHYHGDRAKAPFVTVNCAAFSGTLLESEMFGHEKGAFTGADQRKIGRFELADGGTLFLDEIGNMPMDFQEKILRVIEYQTFERVGGTEPLSLDVRIIAASNADLKKMMADGTFREDLYDRLTFETIQIPPLRKRADDIPILVEFFTERFAHEVTGVEPKTFSKKALEKLKSHPWPGNVRELKNTIERLVYSVPSDIVEPKHLSMAVREPITATTGTGGFKEQVDALEKQLIGEALDATNYNQKQSAKTLELTYDQFRHYYRKYEFGKD